MREAERIATSLGSADPAVGLKAVARFRGLLEKLERLHVDAARAAGWSWSDIAHQLGVSKQAVHAKHGERFRKLKRVK